MTYPPGQSAWPGSWPVANPTAARMYVDIWLMAEFVWKTFCDHTASIDQLLAIVSGGQGALPAADLSRLHQAVADLQGLTSPPTP